MREFVSDIAFTPTVKAAQEQRGSRRSYARMEQKGGWHDTITDDLAAFLAARDSFYLATTNSEGQPYIQHRGGPPGFLKAIGPRTLAFADFGGNKQYITLGNLADNPRAFIFLMDYPNRRRIKVWGRVRVVEGDADLIAKLAEPGYEARPERAILFEIEAWDVNCPQHITPRFTAEQVDESVVRLMARVAELEEKVAALRGAAAVDRRASSRRSAAPDLPQHADEVEAEEAADIGVGPAELQ